MDMTGERRIAASRRVVWDALNDVDILKATIPGCEALEKTDDTHMKATASVKLGPISARFNGAVTLSDIDAPNSYTISGEGQGGVAGFAKGGAKVFLTDAGEGGGEGGTLLKYEVHAQVGGKLAQLGARLIDATAKQLAEQFFTKFTDEVQQRIPAASDAPAGGGASAIGAAGTTAAPASATASAASPEAKPPPVAPPSAVSPLALIPREAFGLPIMGWLGILAFVGMAVLWLASMF
jgi:carbon monoxide dehydrogenase subunit G